MRIEIFGDFSFSAGAARILSRLQRSFLFAAVLPLRPLHALVLVALLRCLVSTLASSCGTASRGRMKAVFLDIDGVLLPFGDPPFGTDAIESSHDECEEGKGRFTERSLKALAKILSETGAEVVLSSTWRCAGGADAIIEEFRRFASRQRKREGHSHVCPLGAIAEKGEFEYTTDPNMHSHRQWEIAAWIDSAQAAGVVVDSWCALDDEELVSIDPLDGGGDFNGRLQHIFIDRHIKTPSNLGLLEHHATQAIAALQRPCCADTGGGSKALSHANTKVQHGRKGKGKRESENVACLVSLGGGGKSAKRKDGKGANVQR